MYKPQTEYSDAELKLIKAVSPHLYNVIHKTSINPMALYTMLVCNAFRDNLCGPHIEALRRAYNAIDSVQVYRCTPEFDKLCEF